MSETWQIDPKLPLEAASLLAPYIQQTPLIPAPSIGERTWIKLENHQRTGAFKVRGALFKLLKMTQEEREKGVVTASAGNHGLGIAYAGHQLGIPVEVHVPSGAALIKCSGMAQFGAHVFTASVDSYDETEVIAKERAVESGAIFVSAFDDPDVAAANGGTVALEILAQLEGPVTIIAPVGGGGLMSGLIAGSALQSESRSIDLIGVQSEACPAMHDSLAGGAAITAMAASESTLAEGLEGGVSVSTFKALNDAGVPVELVSERAIEDAMRFAKAKLGETIEGSAAVAIAWARAHAPPAGRNRVIVVTGGNVDG